MTTSVWLVETSDGECKHLSGVFSSLENAQKFAELVPNPNGYTLDIHLVGINAQLALTKGEEGLWIIRYAPNGQVIKTESVPPDLWMSCEDTETIEDYIETLNLRTIQYHFTVVRAATLESALTIARERWVSHGKVIS